MADPRVVLNQLTESNHTNSLEIIEDEVKRLEQRLRSYEQRRDNLLQAIEWGEFNKDEVLDRVNNIKRLVLADKEKLNDLLKTRDNLASLANATIKFGKLYDQVLRKLEKADLELKRLALDALGIKVYASDDAIEIKGVIPLELALPTTGQASGCLIVVDAASNGEQSLSILPC
ncbi:hypothetical protein ACFLYX_04165 [Chloroflexota bacterium]